MRRREFIVGLGGVAAWPLVANAQEPAPPVIGLLSLGSPELFANLIAGFRKGLNETGFIEGRNVTIDYRFAGADRLPELAARAEQGFERVATAAPRARFRPGGSYLPGRRMRMERRRGQA